MTIELTDLPTIPADQVPAAFTLAAVQTPSGPVRYKVPVATALGGPAGPAGQGLTFRDAWTAATAYAAYDVLTNAGSCYLVTTAFLSGQSFSATNLALIAAKGDPGAAGTGTGSSAAIATTAAAGLVKPDGVTLTIASDGTLTVAGLSASDLTLQTDSLGTDLIIFRRAGVDYASTVAAFVAANQISVTALPAGPGLAGADTLAIYSAAASSDVRYSMAQLVAFVSAQISSGSSGSSSSGSGSGSSGSGSGATAPGQVGSLAAGTPTSTTIPISYTAPSTGTAPITYAASTAPHGTTTWTVNAGTFDGTGGTLTGLTASTDYDIRVVATNTAGSSTTTLTTGVTTAAASAPQRPSLVFTAGPNWRTPGLFGAAALNQYSVGTANPIILPNKFCIEFFNSAQQYSSNGNAGTLNIGVSDGTNDIGMNNVYQNWQLVVGSTATATSANAYTGALQFVTLDYDGTNLNLTVNGSSAGHVAATFAGGSNCTLRVETLAYGAFDNIRVSNISRYPVGTNPTDITSARVSDANTVALYDFDAQTGASS